jgi:hypothetical protein
MGGNPRALGLLRTAMVRNGPTKRPPIRHKSQRFSTRGRLGVIRAPNLPQDLIRHRLSAGWGHQRPPIRHKSQRSWTRGRFGVLEPPTCDRTSCATVSRQVGGYHGPQDSARSTVELSEVRLFRRQLPEGGLLGPPGSEPRPLTLPPRRWHPFGPLRPGPRWRGPRPGRAPGGTRTPAPPNTGRKRKLPRRPAPGRPGPRP